MIIDTHAQLYTREAVKGNVEGIPDEMAKMFKGYSQFFSGKGMELYTIEDMDAAGVDKSVVVAVDAETTLGFKIPNVLVAKMVEKYPDRLIGFASVDPHKGEKAVVELEDAVRNMGLKGLKIIPHLIDVYPNGKLMYPLYEKARELGIPVLLHTGTHFHLGRKIKYCQPIHVDEVAVDFPELKIIIAHFGYPWYQEALAVVQRNFNVYFNIAGWSPRYIPDMVVQHMDSILSHKVLFGSDHPLLPRKRILDELGGLNLKEETMKKLLSENAKRLLQIK